MVVLLTFLWLSHREVEATLIRTSHERAQLAAAQIGQMLETSLAAALREDERIAARREIRALLENPSEERRAAAATVLEPRGSRAARLEVWSASGSLLLEISSADAPDSAGARWEFPSGHSPPSAGVSELQRSGDAVFFELVTPVLGTNPQHTEPLGFVRRFGRISSSSAGPIRGLVGDDAVIRVGTAANAVWTDLTSGASAPPYAGPEDVAEGIYNDRVGRRWVGAREEIAGTPWEAWIGFPRATVVQPAQSFLQRMLLLLLLFVTGGIALAALVSVRLTRPLHALVHAAERITHGDYAGRAPQAGREDEVGRLSAAFNGMAAAVEEAHGTLKKNQEQTDFALAAAKIGVWVVDTDSGRVACSDSIRVVHTLDSEALPTTRTAFLAHVHPEDRQAVRAIMERRDPSAIPADLNYRVLHSDGSVSWIEGKVQVQPPVHGRPGSVLGVSINVTDRRRLELQLRQSQKLEAVGQMAAGIAHDFNNILNVVKGCASLLYKDLPPESTQLREDAAEIERAADRAASLTRQLLAFSRKQVLQPKVIDPNEVVQEVTKLLVRTLPADIDLTTELDPNVCWMEVDPSQFHQVLMNLAVNARDAMPNGGRLTIETCNAEITFLEARKHPFRVKPGHYVCLRVTDTGVGMDEETQAQVFEPFFTTKEVGKGTGLGLASVYGIVKQSGGYIWVRSAPGVGTSFEVRLPVAREPVAQEQPVASRKSTETVREKTILSVEDDAALRKLFRRVLERAGYTVLQAANGEDAMRVAAHHEGPIDMLISDVVMPVMSGSELAEHLSRRHPGIRILFTSGYGKDDVARYGVQSLGPDFVQKPVAPDVLLRRVSEAFAAVSNSD